MKNIPNFITSLNLLAGCLACVMSLQYDHYVGAFVFIVFASIFDFLDGLAARALNAYSKIGAELDSLADVVSFGVAPGCMIYAFLTQVTADTSLSAVPFIAFILPIFTALRLAKFNVDTRQTSSFLGLPVPASGLFWASLIPAISAVSFENLTTFISIIIILLIVFCLLMVSEIPMFSLKFKHLKWHGNEWPFSLIIASVLLLFIFYYGGNILLGVSTIIVVFILMSLLKNRLNREKK